MIRTKSKLPVSKAPVEKMGLPEKLIYLQYEQENTIRLLSHKQQEIQQLTTKLKEIQAVIAVEIEKL